MFARSVFQPVINNAVFFNYHCTNGDGVKRTQWVSNSFCAFFIDTMITEKRCVINDGLKTLRVNTPITLSASKWIFWHFHTLGYLNGSHSFNIHHRDLPLVSFNLELNSAHFWSKKSGLHQKLVGCPLRERASFPQNRWTKRYLVFDGECCLFFSTQLPSSVFTGSTLQVVIIWKTQVFSTW